ncbi:hypothetical protein PR048_029991 [Dryococelus australis]|uniref:DNA helicase Pif1-like 2B domain-containing protein n=1 Tax=Dryococelus australis TaxID=614101 RepID=A0ABQ9G7P5_9NEOP|nr:hypothetical protein PR048_029991 [Dryococelus australis]
MIDSRQKQLKHSEDLFGSISMILFGDLIQLPPIRSNQVFDQPLRLVPTTHLWRLFTLLQSEHFVKLISKINTSSVATGEFSIDKALRIYPTNQQFNDHNHAVLEHFRAKGTTMFKIKAQDKLIDATKKAKNIDIETIIPPDINKTGGMPQKLEIFVGAKVMLRSNIDVDKGLVNGAIGDTTEIILPCFRSAQMYEMDIPSSTVKFSYGTAECRMLPMALSWESTIHKMQGSTVNYAVIYLGLLAKPMLLSVGGIKPCNTEALVEMNRMRNYEQNYD